MYQHTLSLYTKNVSISTNNILKKNISKRLFCLTTKKTDKNYLPLHTEKLYTIKQSTQFSTTSYLGFSGSNSLNIIRHEPDKSYVAIDHLHKRKNELFSELDTFPNRHLGPREHEIEKMLSVIGEDSVDDLIKKVIPNSIIHESDLHINDGGLGEQEMLTKLKNIANKNKIYRSFIGMGYNDTVTPNVILRNLLENPSWYTQYTPYQPEISQGRLESLLNFQTMVQDLTGLPIANSSLLDEGTAAGEALGLCISSSKFKTNLYFFADQNCHPQTLAVLKSRAEGLNTKIIVGDFTRFDFDKSNGNLVGALVSYPDTYGNINDYAAFSEKIHKTGGQLVVCADIMALAVLESPASFGADIAIGNTQRFGVSLGYGGPHAAYFATSDQHKRKIPGRIVGVSRDSKGRKAYRLALQTREQHIRREKATSNICTAQALLANIAAMYVVYHGPKGIKDIANRIHRLSAALAGILNYSGYEIKNKHFFDTLNVHIPNESSSEIINRAENSGINLRYIDNNHVGISLDETVTLEDLSNLAKVFNADFKWIDRSLDSIPADACESNYIPKNLFRKSEILTHPIFNKYHSETEMLRYLTHLQKQDLSLANSMIPLGSCTMKLNATAEMIPITWPEFAKIHPFAPKNQTPGYAQLISELEHDLAQITNMDGTSLQPNSGAQGELTGLKVIKKYQESTGQGHRNICLIPTSAHGTNPASAVIANLKVVTIKCTSNGYLDFDDLKAKAEKHAKHLSSVMITYPSTYGVFEERIEEMISIVHKNGGQVYIDGANLNAQIGFTSPGKIGADVCHLNLHKSLCIPHGGGGPGVGPICVKSHLVPFLPGHPLLGTVSDHDSKQSILPSASAPFGSAGILPITWAYIKLMGGAGLTKATETAILNANYMLKRLSKHYQTLYTNNNNYCAHEFIINLQQFSKSSGLSVVDISKRLQDYGIHPPTMSWPSQYGIMIEPTESESLQEIDKFCDAMIQIKKEIEEIENGHMPRDNNVLINSPHCMEDLLTDKWDHPYTRENAAYPLAILRKNKFWPTVSRVDDAFGDTNLVCSCPPLSDYE
ncbi:hypothetical protein BB561_004503 [Smittium simulii]|uniref:Glycine cleavage system P protein n=1 Tax=Smittium simulii TaxID=133385 RepID=A0A2T9YFU6_9FUNG|nr:hypothetical protein BB561_004503 [Smittium simulii]